MLENLMVVLENTTPSSFTVFSIVSTNRQQKIEHLKMLSVEKGAFDGFYEKFPGIISKKLNDELRQQLQHLQKQAKPLKKELKFRI